MEQMNQLSTSSIINFNVPLNMNLFLQDYAQKILYRRFKEINTGIVRQKMFDAVVRRLKRERNLDDKTAKELAGLELGQMEEEILLQLARRHNIAHSPQVPFITLENIMVVFSPATGSLFRWAFIAFLCQHETLRSVLSEETKEEMSVIFRRYQHLHLTAKELDRTIEMYFPETFGLDRDALKPSDDEYPLGKETLELLRKSRLTLMNLQEAYMDFVVETAVPELRKLLKVMRMTHVERVETESYLHPDFFVTSSYSQEFNVGLKEDREGGRFTCLYPQKEVW